MQKLAEVCVRRPVFAICLMLVFVVVGGFSFSTLGIDRFPRIDLPTVSVSTSNLGASPQEIETEITDPIEGAVNTIPGIDEVRSTSSQGRSNVNITFDLEKDPDIAAQEVRDKVSTVLNRLPDTADPPIVQKFDPDSQPVIQYALGGKRSTVELSQIADKDIRERIETVDGVGEVFIYGERLRQIQVFINPERLRAYNLSITEVANALRAQNLERPAGQFNEGAKIVTLRTLSKIEDVADFNNVVVANRNGYAVKISDIGRVEDGGVEPRSAASLNGNPAVSLAIRKQSGANTVAVIQGVRERMKEIQPTLPKDLTLVLTRDQSEFIETSLHAIEEHLIVGSILAALIVFLFLRNFRTTLIAALAIPISIIATFAAIKFMGYTLNQMTMLALTLMVGIVIDDAIVVLENIYRYVEEKGMEPFQAAIEATREISLAVMATTLSLLAVFIPVGFLSGIVGRFMSSFGVTASFAIAVSMLVSFTLTPMLAARWIKRKEKGARRNEKPGISEVEAHQSTTSDQGDVIDESSYHAHSTSKDQGFYRYIDRSYTWMLHKSMRFRWAVVIICVLVIASIVPLYNLAGVNFVPEEDESSFNVTVRAPIGTSLAATNTIINRVARDLREQIPEVMNTVTVAGFGGSQATNAGFVFVTLKPPSERETSQADIITKARGITRKYPKEYRISATPNSSIARSVGAGGRSSSIGFYITGPDIKKLETYSDAVIERVKENKNIRDADSSLVLGNPEIRFRIDRRRAADLGVQAGDISNALSILAAGQLITTFNDGSDQYDVLVRADENSRRERTDLSGFTVQSASGVPVELSSVVTPEEGTSPASIERLNRERVVTIFANVAQDGSESEALEALQQAINDVGLEAGYRTGVTGQSKELAAANQAFMIAFALSFVFMYLILAAQFESFIHPVTILLTLPLSVPFALLSTFIAGQKLNIFSALGILLLFGIVKKNAILQIDHTNQLRAGGMERYDAIIQANRDRLRPILMTTLALVAGMLPLIWGSGAGAATNRSIAVLIVGGQSLCLLLTLLAVPVFYSLFEDAQESRVWSWMSARTRLVTNKVSEPVAAGWSRVRAAFSRSGKRRAKERFVDQTGD